jgi:SAM-dependent methyltransferase
MKTKLHLGCGLIHKEGYINIDHIKTNATDIVLDINKISSKFNKESMDEILMINVLEHLDNPINIIKDCYTLLNKDGKLIIEVPHFTNPNNHNDPTHKTMFGHGWFNPFVNCSPESDYLFDFKFSSLKKELIFSHRKSILLNAFQKIANKNMWFYEYSPLKIITCMRLKVILIK